MLESWLDQVLLFIFAFLIGSCFFVGLQFLKMFIHSKPPGRRLVSWKDHNKNTQQSNLRKSKFYTQVTADIHVYHATVFQGLIVVFTLMNMTKAFFIYIGYWSTFFFCEIIKISFSLLIAFANVSSLLQVAIMFDFR